MSLHLTTAQRPQWRQLQHRFGSGRECLASYLALEAAEVIAGAKPANLFAVSSQPQGCGRNLYRLWRRFGAQLLAEAGLKALEMRQRPGSVLLLVYRPEVMDELLARPNVMALLRCRGFGEPLSAEAVLGRLRETMRAGNDFPHEIGVVLGYPLKDVAGFMQLAPIPFACNGPWKIYGKPQRSLELAETFRRCRQQMAGRLAACQQASQCLASCDGRQSA